MGSGELQRWYSGDESGELWYGERRWGVRRLLRAKRCGITNSAGTAYKGDGNGREDVRCAARSRQRRWYGGDGREVVVRDELEMSGDGNDVMPCGEQC